MYDAGVCRKAVPDQHSTHCRGNRHLPPLPITKLTVRSKSGGRASRRSLPLPPLRHARGVAPQPHRFSNWLAGLGMIFASCVTRIPPVNAGGTNVAGLLRRYGTSAVRIGG